MKARKEPVTGAVDEALGADGAAVGAHGRDAPAAQQRRLRVDADDGAVLDDAGAGARRRPRQRRAETGWIHHAVLPPPRTTSKTGFSHWFPFSQWRSVVSVAPVREQELTSGRILL